MTVDGLPVETESTFQVISPATGEVVGVAPDCTRDQLDRAMEAAQSAFGDWRRSDAERIDILHRIAVAVEAHADEIALTQTLEQGRPIEASVASVRHAAGRVRYYADLDIPTLVVRDDDEARVSVVRKPLGVVAIIKPWNSPATNVLNAMAPAIRAGNTTVIKPSPFTPLSALVIGDVIRDVIPPGVVNVVSGRDPLGEWMARHPVPRGISFTGSTATGRLVNEAAARDLKRVVLELGGNDAAIVLDDADPDEVACRLFWLAFRNTGQVCMAIKRVYVPDSMVDRFSQSLARVARSVVVGDPLSSATELGPITNRAQFERVKELVDDAFGRGATAVAGGHPVEGPGYFYEPTVLTGVSEGARIVDEEQFGPVLPVMGYRSVDEAIERANGTVYGLGASVWSADLTRAAQVADRLESGTVWINTHGQTSELAPFGGVKGSGLGTQLGIWSIYAFTDPQTVWTAPI